MVQIKINFALLFPVEAAYLESDLMMTISASTWQDISELIGLTNTNMMDMDTKQ